MRNEAKDFALGLIPMALTGLFLTIAGGRRTLVYCGTLTPYYTSSCTGYCTTPCLQTAWIPYWDGLYVVLAGVLLGAALAFAGTPFPRSGRSGGTVLPGGERPAHDVGTRAPERNPSATTHLLGVDTMPPHLDKG